MRWAGHLRSACTARATGLAVVRVAVCVSWLLVLDERLGEHFAAYPRELRFPPGAWRWFIDAFPFDGALVRAAFKVGVLGAVLGALGVRAGLWAALIAGGYVVTVPQLFGKINHSNHVLFLTLLLAVSPCADALSLDRRRARGAGVEYGAPIQLAAALIGLCYFFPGVWKLWGSGLEWCSAGTLRTILHEKWAELGGFEPPLRIDHSDAVCSVLAAGTLAFELAFLPLLLCGRRARYVLVGAGVMFHAGTLRVPWAAVIVGVLLILGMVREGFARGQNWPLGLYPTFEARAHEHRAEVVILVAWSDGSTRELTEVMLGAHGAPERARGLFASILEGAASRRAERLAAVWEVWKGLDPSLASAANVKFVLRIVPIRPGSEGVEREETLLELACGGVGRLDVR